MRRIVSWARLAAGRSVAAAKGGRTAWALCSDARAASYDAKAAYEERSKEKEADKLFEEEEFSAMRRSAQDEEITSFTLLCVRKANALERELERIHWVLYERPQMVLDTAACSLRGRPTRIDEVMRWLSAQANKSATTTATTTTRRGAVELQNIPLWRGTSSPTMRLYGTLRGFLHGSRLRSGKDDHAAAGVAQPVAETQLATLNADIDYIRRISRLHALNYYSRLNLTPARHIGLACYYVVWNVWIATMNALGCVFYGALRGVTRHGGAAAEKGRAYGVLCGTLRGMWNAGRFLLYGYLVSPLVQLPRGLCNSFYGPVNAVTGRYVFEVMSGRWERCTAADGVRLRHLWQREKRLIRTVGRIEFARKRMQTQSRWVGVLRTMGFSVEDMQRRAAAMARRRMGQKGGPDLYDEMPNPYDTLQVPRGASAKQVKAQYKRLAMLFHPDVVAAHTPYSSDPAAAEAERRRVQARFEDISAAYQILSNPEKRRAYDKAGIHGLKMYDSRFGHFLSRTVEEMVQSVFGGEGFRHYLVGELLRTHWSLRFEAQVSVSLHELEELQAIRIRQLARELARMVDVHAKQPQEQRPRSFTPIAAVQAKSHATSDARNAKKSNTTTNNNNNNNNKNASRVGTRQAMDSLFGNTTASRKSSSATRRTQTSTAADTNKDSSVFDDDDGEEALSASPFVLRPGSNADSVFSREYQERCERLVDRLAEACFGRELLDVVGEAYIVGAQRFLRLRPFYAPKWLQWRTMGLGLLGIVKRNVGLTKDTSSKERNALAFCEEMISSEFDVVIADLHGVLRYVVQCVLQDVAESAEVRRRRAYAMWYLGTRMRAKGVVWQTMMPGDATDMIAYVQQAATSASTTSPPPPF